MELLKLSLQLCGAQVYAAVSMEEAMRMFHMHRPNMLVSDLALPQGHGISLLKAIRGQAPGMAAIALTAISDFNIRQQAMDAGFDRYLVKPVDYDVLIKAVSALASKAGKLPA